MNEIYHHLRVSGVYCTRMGPAVIFNIYRQGFSIKLVNIAERDTKTCLFEKKGNHVDCYFIL